MTLFSNIFFSPAVEGTPSWFSSLWTHLQAMVRDWFPRKRPQDWFQGHGSLGLAQPTVSSLVESAEVKSAQTLDLYTTLNKCA